MSVAVGMGDVAVASVNSGVAVNTASVAVAVGRIIVGVSLGLVPDMLTGISVAVADSVGIGVSVAVSDSSIGVIVAVTLSLLFHSIWFVLETANASKASPPPR